MAKVVRWRLLAKQHFTVRETDLILGSESLMKLGSLVWESREAFLRLLCLVGVSASLLGSHTPAIIICRVPKLIRLTTNRF